MIAFTTALPIPRFHADVTERPVRQNDRGRFSAAVGYLRADPVSLKLAKA